MKTVRTILIVDDSDDDEFLLRRSLKKAGIPCSLLRLSDGQEAIDYFARKGIFADRVRYPDTDLVFLDIHMPRVSGFEVLAWLQKNTVEPAPFIVVMLSSSSENRDRTKAAELGAHNYSTKPPGPELFDSLTKANAVQWAPPV